MKLEVDYCPTSKRKHYFISVSLNKNEAISFDHTTKGRRIVKQRMMKKEPFKKMVKKYGKVNGEWDTIIIKDRKFVKKYHVKWIDCDKIDIINDDVWETIWEEKLKNDIDSKLLYYSRLISDNYNNLSGFFKELLDFEKLLSEEIAKYKKN